MGTPMTTLGDRTAWLGRRTAHSEAHIPFNDLNAERHEGCRFRMSADRSRAGRSGKHLLVLSLTGLTALMVVYL